MAYKPSEFRKGLKVSIDGEPYIMTHFEFKKPGKGSALYICKLKNLRRQIRKIPISQLTRMQKPVDLPFQSLSRLVRTLQRILRMKLI